MSMRSLRAVLCLLALSVLACSSPTEPRQLQVIAAANTVTISNPNDWTVFYLLANPQFLAVVDLALCEDPSMPCPRVPPHGNAQVAYTDIVGYENGESEATLWHWRLERQLDGTYRAREFQMTTLTLH
jgi:hypothetical protein